MKFETRNPIPARRDEPNPNDRNHNERNIFRYSTKFLNLSLVVSFIGALEHWDIDSDFGFRISDFAPLALAVTFTIFTCMAINGCVTSPAPQRAVAPPRPAAAGGNINTDPTSIYLHDLAGALLVYYSQYGQLPARLEDVAGQGPDALKDPAIDPATRQRFFYDPRGVPIMLNGSAARVIVYQLTPSGPQGRWSLMFTLAHGGIPELGVQRLPASLFR